MFKKTLKLTELLTFILPDLRTSVYNSSSERRVIVQGIKNLNFYGNYDKEKWLYFSIF